MSHTVDTSTLELNIFAQAALVSAMCTHVVCHVPESRTWDWWAPVGEEDWNRRIPNEAVKWAEDNTPHDYQEFVKWYGEVPIIRPHTVDDFKIARTFVSLVARTGEAINNSY